jgi:CxxC motif-containing protein
VVEEKANANKYYINELKNNYLYYIQMTSNFQTNIQTWVQVDNKIKTLQNEVKELRVSKNTLTQNIFTYAESNNLENAVIQISDGKLKFASVKQTSPISFKLVEEVLKEHMAEETVNQLMLAIRNKRGVRYVSDIKRSYK